MQVLEVASGALLQELGGGHYESINCCSHSAVREELYTGGNDGQVGVRGQGGLGGNDGR